MIVLIRQTNKSVFTVVISWIAAARLVFGGRKKRDASSSFINKVDDTRRTRLTNSVGGRSEALVPTIGTVFERKSAHTHMKIG